MGAVYLASNKVNGKAYVGFTFDLIRRQEGHKRDTRDGSMLAFHCAIRKYGWDAFEWSVVYEDDEDSDREWMGWWERKFIKKLGTKVPNGYNMTDGGDGGAMEYTDEHREKIGKASREYWSDEKNRK
jgi:group I intron endonuclease